MKEYEKLSTEKRISCFLDFLKNVSPFYRFSYYDLLLIQKYQQDIPEKIFCNIENLEFKINEVKKSYRLGNYHYPQRFPNSCAIACYMMAKSNYSKDVLRPNRKLEKIILDSMNNEVSITKLLAMALKDDLKVKIFSSIDYRNIIYKNPKEENLREEFVDFWKVENDNGRVQFNFGMDLDYDLLKELLMNGESVLINGTFNGIPHMRLVSGYSNENFVISDPLQKRKSEISFENLENISTPPLGQFYFSISSKNFE